MTDLTTITARDPDIVAAEINTIKKNVQQIMIAGALEIGGKLVEAKGMVPHGQWGKWLEEKVNYSQSTANNMMKLYQEYGGNQQSLFDTWTNSQAFAEMSYTQHLALLALPFAQRQEFAEANQVAEMSTRELERRIREELKSQFSEQIAAAEKRADDAEAELADAREDRDKAQSAARDANAEADEYLRQKNDAEKAAQDTKTEKERAEKAEENALSLVDKLTKRVAEAEAAARVAQEELTTVKQNPSVPDDVMDALRKEAEAAAAEKAAAEFKEQLEAAQAIADKATREKIAAEEAARAADAELEEIQKAAKVNNPDMMAIQTLMESMMVTWNTIQGHRMKAIAAKPEVDQPLRAFLTKALATMQAGLDQQ